MKRTNMKPTFITLAWWASPSGFGALRRRDVGNAQVPCWVDCYASRDHGRSWSFSSRIGQTGAENGNPPGLTVLKDGRVVCAYGDRSRDILLARVSAGCLSCGWVPAGRE